MAGDNRPYKYGSRDRREYIVQDSEVAVATVNNLAGSPVFLGRAKVGSKLSEDRWQIRKITYDSSSGVTRVEWPENSEGAASADYLYKWSDVSNLFVTGVTQASTAVVTVSDIGALYNGAKVIFQDVVGMTQLNFNGANIYTVANISGNTFELSGINSSGYTAYTSGGAVVYGDFLQLTYA